VKRYLENTFGYRLDYTVDYLRCHNTFDETCQVTVPQAIVCFMESNGFEDAIRNAISIGGDSDTIGAITGALAEAFYTVPDDIRTQALTYLDPTMKQILSQFGMITGG
jgi:ADP-ribosylglycohydrolase